LSEEKETNSYANRRRGLDQKRNKLVRQPSQRFRSRGREEKEGKRRQKEKEKEKEKHSRKIGTRNRRRGTCL